MLGGFPNLVQLQLLHAIDHNPPLDRFELQRRAGYRWGQHAVCQTLTEMRRLGWTRPLPHLARAENGRAHIAYATTRAGKALLVALQALGDPYREQLLGLSGVGYWPSANELRIMQLLQSRRIGAAGLSVTELIQRLAERGPATEGIPRRAAQLLIAERLLKDSVRAAERKGHIRLEEAPRKGLRAGFLKLKCTLTQSGRGVLELHRLSANALRRRAQLATLERPLKKKPPTILEQTAIEVLLRHPRGIRGDALRACLPSDIRWPSVLVVLARVRQRGWIYRNRPGTYELTPHGRRGASAAQARWVAAFRVRPHMRRAKRSGAAVPGPLRGARRRRASIPV
jgi:hypothetical protein